MTLRESLGSAFRETHPVLFAVGFAIALLQTASLLGSVALQSAVGPVYGVLLGPAATWLALVVVTPLAVGLYVPIREDASSARAALATAVRAVRERYVSVLAADAVAFAVAATGAAVASLLWLVGHTGVQFLRYSIADPAPPAVGLTLLQVRAVFVAGFVAAALCVRFADLFVAFDGAKPATAWRRSLSAVRRRPVSFLGYAAVTAVLLGTPQVIALAGGSLRTPAAVVTSLVVVVLLGGVGLVLASAIHVAYFERTVSPAVDGSPAASVRWSRVAAVGVVLVAAVAGAAAVRHADVGVGQEPAEDLPSDPQAALAVAVDNTEDANRRRTVLTRNESDPNASFRRMSSSAVDYDERRVSTYFYGENGVTVGGFQGEGTIGIVEGGGPRSDSLAPLTRRTEGWVAIAAPGYGTVAPDEAAPAPEPGEFWTVASRNQSAIVYRVEDTGAIDRAFTGNYVGMREPLAEESYLEVVVDREAGVVSRVEFRVRSLESGEHFRYLMRYEDVGSADLDRPGGLGPRSSVEQFWDVLYY